MDEQHTPRPRRRRKTPTEIFKEAYLPYLILLAGAVVMLILIIGAICAGG